MRRFIKKHDIEILLGALFVGYVLVGMIEQGAMV